MEADELVEGYDHHVHPLLRVVQLLTWPRGKEEIDGVNKVHGQRNNVCDGQRGQDEVCGRSHVFTGPDDGVNNIEHYPCRADDDTDIAVVEAVPRHPLRKVPRFRNVVHRIYCWKFPCFTFRQLKTFSINESLNINITSPTLFSTTKFCGVFLYNPCCIGVQIHVMF